MRLLKIYLLHLRTSQQIAWEYRFSYLFRIFRIILDFGISLLIINIFFANTTALGDWSRSEVFLVYAISQIISSLYNLICGDSLDELDQEVRLGALDKYLAKPVDSQFLLSTRRVFPSVIYRIILSTILLIHAFSQLHIFLSLYQIIWGLVTVISGVIIYYSFVFAAATTSFWTFGGETTDLVSAIVRTSRFPLDIFSQTMTKLFTFVPLIFIATVPARLLLGKSDYLYLASPFVALIMFFTVRKFWFFALKHYSSASS